MAYKMISLWDISEESIPSDDIVIRYALLKKEYSILMYIIAGLLFILTTIMMVCLTLGLYNSSEIRVTSPLLSLLMFLVCYVLLTAACLAISQQLRQFNENDFGILCNAENLLTDFGGNLISLTVLVKIIRINHIFNQFHKTGKIWHDGYLFMIIVLVMSVIQIFNTILGWFICLLEHIYQSHNI